MIDALLTTLLVGAAAGAVSLALARGRIFDPVRARLTGWAAEIAGCPLCLGFWACGALWAAQGFPPGLTPPVAWGASWAVSAATSYGILRLSGEQPADE